jgi:hypothetical protein
MRINKIYNKKTVDKHFEQLNNLEKKAVFYEKIIFKFKDIQKFINLEKNYVFFEYLRKIIYNVFFLLILFIIQKILLSINIPIYIKAVAFFKDILNFNSNNYFNYLVACLGVGGFLTALFFSNLSGILSSKYSNLTTKISSSILNEYMNRKYFESIINYLVLLILELLCYSLGINLNLLIVVSTFFLTIRIIIIFIILSKRIFRFNNVNYITLDMCQEILYYFDKLKIAVKHTKKDSIILSYSNAIKSRLNILEELYDSFVKEDDIKGLGEFNSYIIDLLSEYCFEKNIIPFDDLWYDDKVKPKNWFEAEFFEVKTGIQTGTSLRPNFEKNTYFFEDIITNIIIKSIKYFTNRCEKNELYDVLNSYHLHFRRIKDSGNFKYWNSINKKIIDCIISNNSLFKDEDDKTLLIVDLVGLLYVDYILDFTNYIDTLYNQINSCTKNIEQFVKSIGKNNYILSSNRTNELIEKLRFERKIERKYITTDYYIKEYVFWELNKYIVEYVESFSKIIDDVRCLGEKLYKNSNKISSCIILSRNIEISRKIDDSISRLSIILNKINKLNINFEYKQINLKKINKEKEKIYISSLILYSDVVTALSIDEYDYRDKNIDFYGECFYNLNQEVFNAILDEDFDRFKILYEKFIMVAIICDEIVHKIINLNYNDNYKLSKYKIPMLQFMDISGYAIYYSHLTNKKEWEDLVKSSFQKVVSVSENKQKFMKKLVATASIDSSILCIDILKSDFKLQFQHFVKNSNYLKYKTEGPFSQEVVDSDDKLLSDFTFFNGEFYNNFYEIFIYYYVNPEVDESDKFKVKFFD